MDSLTREPLTDRGDPARRSRRWLMAVLCLLVLAGIGYAIWFWPAGSANQAARNRDANQPIPVLVGDRRTEGRADLSGRARHRAGVQHRDGEGRWSMAR